MLKKCQRKRYMDELPVVFCIVFAFSTFIPWLLGLDQDAIYDVIAKWFLWPLIGLQFFCIIIDVILIARGKDE